MSSIVTDFEPLEPAPVTKRWRSAQSPRTLLGHSKLINFLRSAVNKEDGDTYLSKEMANEMLRTVLEREHAFVAPISMERQISEFSETESKLGRNISFRNLAVAVNHMSGKRRHVNTKGRRRSALSDGISVASIESLMSDFDIEKGSELAEELTHIDNITSPDFNVLALCDKVGGDSNSNSKALEIVGYSILLHYSLVEKLSLNNTVVKSYLNAVGNAYNKVPYHNAAHGADVMQTMASNIKASPEFLGALSDETLFAGLMAACVHDVGHPGKNNLFLDKTDDELALRYNDQSILENYHISYSMELMKRPGCDILSSYSKEKKRNYRKILIHCILETDLAKHRDTLNQLNEDLETAASKPEIQYIDAAESKNHVRCLGLLLHCCDISNPAKKWQIYRKWTDKIVTEFNNQYEEEEKLGITHGFYNPETPLPEFQIGFINFLVLPFYVAVNCVKGINLDTPLFELNKNLQAWKLQLVGRSIRLRSTAPSENVHD
eukprot:g7405.t1